MEGNPLGVEAAGVFLRLHRHRRRRHRGATLGHSECASGALDRSADADCLGHPGLERSTVAIGHAGEDRGANRRHSRSTAHLVDRDGDDGEACGRKRCDERRRKSRRAARRAAGVSVLRSADAAGRPSLLARFAEGQRRACEARASRAAGTECRRSVGHWQIAVHHSRCHRERARPVAQRI